MDFQIVPYVNRDGLWSISDEAMAAIFLEMKESRILEKVFYAGKIREFKHFLMYLKHKGNVVHTVWNDERPVMLAWLNDWSRHAAQAHFLTLPIIWKEPGATLEVGKMTMDYWFGWKDPDGEPLLKVLTGRTPSHFKAPLRYVKQLGAVTIGEIPNAIYDAYQDRSVGCVISYMERRE